tara:strand:- start:8698 stop:9252 length:555 start_codon:yes stop_codon:yes gene_type:complete
MKETNKLDWLKVIYKDHKEWINIVKGFGENVFAEDIVMETYIRISKYATPENIIQNNKAHRGYMYISLRSVYYQYYNVKKRIDIVNIDDYKGLLQLPNQTNLEEQEAFHSVCLLIDEIAEDWSWYDRKLFKVYRDSGLSIRKIAAGTKISWVSVFNTIKNCKQDVEQKIGETYKNYKNRDYDKI